MCPAADSASCEIWIFCEIWIPRCSLLTDNGPQFRSAQFAGFADRWRCVWGVSRLQKLAPSSTALSPTTMLLDQRTPRLPWINTVCCIRRQVVLCMGCYWTTETPPPPFPGRTRLSRTTVLPCQEHLLLRHRSHSKTQLQWLVTAAHDKHARTYPHWTLSTHLGSHRFRVTRNGVCSNGHEQKVTWGVSTNRWCLQTERSIR